ncbi:c-type cytochrome biogenesis protein CcmI [Pseudomonas sp. SDO5532_S415]
MIDFWLVAGLLLLVALNFLLIPVLRGCHALREEDRTAQNVALYQNRLEELQTQQVEGVLDAAQMDAGCAEAARELLADTEGITEQRISHLGKPAPLLVAILVPVLGLCMYLHFGARDKVELTREFAQPAGSLAVMTSRLERAVNAQPESAESAYFLAQNYMAQGRPEDAAKMFERTVSLAGRRPEFLGGWAEALYFSNGKKWSATVQALTDEALANDPNELVSLSLLGLSAFEEKRYVDALKYWNQALIRMSSDDISRTALIEGIKKAEEGASKGRDNTDLVNRGGVDISPILLRVRVEISPEIINKVGLNDSVFVFVQTVSGSKVPLAAKRLKVSNLPVELEFSDADVMIISSTLSRAGAIQVTARVSKNGKPASGEWLGRGSATINSKSTKLNLMIDRADI